MKKKKIFLKVLLILFLLILFVLFVGLYLIYQKVNNISAYEDHFFYDYPSYIKENENHSFKDCIFYNTVDRVFEYQVPAYYLYEVINENSMSEILSLPEGLRIDRVAVDLDFDKKNAIIYNSIIVSDKKGHDLINTCLEIKADLLLSEDKSQVQLVYSDFCLINDAITERGRQYVVLKKGDLLFKHHFPTNVVYYRMPDYRPDFVYDTSYDGEYIYAKYDIVAAMKDYLDTTQYHEDPLEECMEKVWLEVRMNNIAH